MIWKPLDWLATWVFVGVVKYFAWRVNRSVKFQPIFIIGNAPPVRASELEKEKMN